MSSVIQKSEIRSASAVHLLQRFHVRRELTRTFRCPNYSGWGAHANLFVTVPFPPFGADARVLPPAFNHRGRDLVLGQPAIAPKSPQEAQGGRGSMPHTTVYAVPPPVTSVFPADVACTCRPRWCPVSRPAPSQCLLRSGVVQGCPAPGIVPLLTKDAHNVGRLPPGAGPRPRSVRPHLPNTTITNAPRIHSAAKNTTITTAHCITP